MAAARCPRPEAPARCPPSPPYLEPNKPFRHLVLLCARSTSSHPPPLGPKAVETPQTDSKCSAVPGALGWWGQIYWGGEVEHSSVPALVHPKTPQHTVGLAGGPSMWLLPRLKVPVLTVLGSVCVGWRGEGGLAMGLLSSTDKLYNMSVALNSGQASIRQDGVGGPTQSPVISNGGGMVMEMGDVVLE